ncbi:MAG: pyrrolo-quinoline quinone [Planctomycetes bacterium]|nr:pyrrolo-quinoline quinone [Planctomycetota bacterium]
MTGLQRAFGCLTLVATSLAAQGLAAQGPPEASPAKPQHWPQFRGAHAGGVADCTVPTTWDVDKGTNVAWKTEVPGLAHSSPIVWGDRVFVTTAVRKGEAAKLSSLYGSKGYGAGDAVADEASHEFKVYCFDKNSGKVVWQRTAHVGVPRAKRHPKSSHANCTPACDAERLVVFFASEGLFCFDHDGELLWKRDLGVLDSGAPGYGKKGYQWGFASSPVLFGDRVFVQCDHEGESFVASIDLKNGKDVWRVARDEDSTWCTPTVLPAGPNNVAQVILNGYKHIGGYDLATGNEVWKLVGGGDVPVPTPVVAHGLVFLTSAHGRSRPLRAVKVTARRLLKDDNADEYIEWEHRRRGVYMQTPLAYGDQLYACSDGGILSCYEAETGLRVYRQRLGTGKTGFSGSPVAAGGKVYLSGEVGEVHVVKAGEDFKLLAVNDMGATLMATPAIAGGTLFVRTRHHVIALREK